MQTTGERRIHSISNSRTNGHTYRGKKFGSLPENMASKEKLVNVCLKEILEEVHKPGVRNIKYKDSNCKHIKIKNSIYQMSI